MTTDTTSVPAYFDNSMSGIAFINRLERRDSDTGQWIAARIAVMTGDKDAKPVRTQKYQASIVGNMAKKIANLIIDYEGSSGLWESGSGAPTITSLVRVGNLTARYYLDSQGEVIPYIDGRIVSLRNVKLNGELLVLPENLQSMGPSQPEKESIDEQTTSVSEIPPAATPEADGSEDVSSRLAGFIELALRKSQMELGKSDPDFKEKKALLKREGFVWVPKLGAWALPAGVNDDIPF